MNSAAREEPPTAVQLSLSYPTALSFLCWLRIKVGKTGCASNDGINVATNAID